MARHSYVVSGFSRTFLVALLVVPALRAQEGVPAFEASSIKESTEPTPFRPPPDRFIRRYITLTQLVLYAYDLSAFQIEGGPEWVRERHYDVEAKADRARPADEMRLMVRRLLAQRFSLRTHIESREMSRYALVMARNDKRLGPRLKPSAFDCPAIIAARGSEYRPPPGPPQPGDPPRCGIAARLGGGSRTMLVEGQPMAAIAKLLQGQAGRVVVDRTGLTGTYDIELETEIPNIAGIPSNTRASRRQSSKFGYDGGLKSRFAVCSRM